MDDLARLSLEVIEKNKQALVFMPTRVSAEKSAEDIAKLTNIQLFDLEKEILKVVSTPTQQCRRLSHCIKKGIAFHHSGLTNEQKDIIEDNFRNGKVKIICCTPTLAAGMSLPAFRVIIKSLKRFSGGWGQDWIPVLEYMQMAGRAGRPEYEKFGESVIVARDEKEKEEIFERYIKGVPEDIYSKLAVEPVLRTYLLSLISSGVIQDAKSLKEFFSKTFWAHQFKDIPRLEAIMEKILQLLEGWKFVQVQGNAEEGDFVSASHLNGIKERKLRPTLIGKRVSQLYLDPLTAKHLLEGLEKYSKDKTAFSLLQLVSHTLEMRPLLRVKSKEQDKVQEELTKNYDQLLEDEPPVYDAEYEEFINSVKTSLFLQHWINEMDEDFLMEEYDIRPGEIRVKLEIADWLFYALEELAKITNLDHEKVREISKLRVRVKYGIKEELLNLLKLKGIGRVRARKLVQNNLRDLGDLKKLDLTSLGQILGKAVAEDVKKQLGEEIVEEISSHKRKGQMSLGKYE